MMYKIPKPMSATQPPVVDAVERHDDDGTVWMIPFDPANTDYQEYLEWLAEGNEPLPSDTPAE